MNRIMLTLTATLLTCALIGCAPPPSNESPSNSDTTPIDKVRTDFSDAFNAGDAARVAGLYTADGVVMPAHQPAITGHDAIENYNKQMFDMYTAKISITPAETKVYGDRGMDRGTFTLELTPKAGGNPIMDEGKYLVLLQRQSDGSWKVTHDIDNTNLPREETPREETK
ncbi:MAG TPA: SgcJ/EcaC family oxidoreductase [Terriglobia bacterium]|nr:SgcJ/EcaC family oxidoreductase [Terriglobia bacterium]